jgi:predicted Zn-dependent peptidase
MKGFKAKVDNRPVKPEEQEENETQVSSPTTNDLSDEISKLNELHKSGVLTQEEFEKAKSKLLNN